MQSINLVENREFRDLLLLLRESLQDNDIPHRTKVREAIIDAWILYYLDLQAQLQIGHFTMDNASNNQTFMECLERLLAERGILDFSAEKNYIRCFAHIVNLCSQACIKAMEADDDTSPQYPDTDTDSATETDTPDNEPTRRVRKTRKTGPICRTRKTQPHVVQQVMSAENIPVLAGALPAFELFVDSWKTMVKDVDLIKENVVQFIKPGLAIAKKYYNRFGDTDTYIIAMFINPSIRFAWIEKNWGSEDIKAAREIIIAKVGSRSRQPSRSRATAGPSSNPTLQNRYRKSQKALDFSSHADVTANEGTWSAEEEMQNYLRSPIPPRKSTDMVGYWDVCTQWPTIFLLFADYGPIQATSVPSERVFSSSAETDTKRRNRISPILMEALQMLKFSYKKSRLNFMADWQAPALGDDEEDWLRSLATASETDREVVRKGLFLTCEDVETEYPVMPEDQPE
ncbi:ribonuclease H-like domain-containing protein [Mycena sanguinolenta]|nr:ribonuclease H-like domain-containing protein [Mycena sanguinolenta]